MSPDCCRVYEQDSLHALTGPAIRPGGIALTEHALSLCALEAGQIVLDVGCGAAATVEHLAATRPVRALGLDPSRKLLRAGRQRRADLPLLQARGETLPLASGRFDVLLAECCLSLMEDTDLALAEFARVLRPGGMLVLSDIYARDPAALPEARGLALDCCLTKALSREMLEAGLVRHHFAITLWEDHTHRLKSLAGQIIFEHGSLDQFWGELLGANASGLTRTTNRLKPGYFLLLARKEN